MINYPIQTLANILNGISLEEVNKKDINDHISLMLKAVPNNEKQQYLNSLKIGSGLLIDWITIRSIEDSEIVQEDEKDQSTLKRKDVIREYNISERNYHYWVKKGLKYTKNSNGRITLKRSDVEEFHRHHKS